jgi:hypothetical protein
MEVQQKLPHIMICGIIGIYNDITDPYSARRHAEQLNEELLLLNE